MPRRKNSVPARLNVSDDDCRPEIGLGFVIKKRRVSHKRFPNQSNKLKITIKKCSPEESKLFIGKMNIGTSLNVFPNEWTKCTLIGDEHSLKLNFDENTDAVVQIIADFELLKAIFTSKLFLFLFDISEETQCNLLIHLRELPIIKTIKSVNLMLRQLMADFFNINTSDVYEIGKTVHEDAEDLYEGVKTCTKQLDVANSGQNVQHPNLLPELRPYQANAVRWMIKKEEISIIESLDPMYIPLKLKSGFDIYYNKYSGCIESVKPIVKYIESCGILADEMGLGKTVEVLACILNHPRMIETTDETPLVPDESIPTIETQPKYVKPKEKLVKAKQVKNSKMSATKRAAQIWYEEKLAELQIKVKRKPTTDVEVQCICGDLNLKGIVTCRDCKKKQHAVCMNFKSTNQVYCCPQCWFNKPLLKSKATLIVSPTSINRQWSLEIQRHIRKNGLKVLEYKGVHDAGMIYPTELADYDLVITTYNILQSELRFTSEQPVFSFRNAKRYNAPTTPLVFIEWWRLCLDEAQSIECPTSQISCMAQQLCAVNRWAVTGTPIQKTTSDLYSLVDYLQLSPYNDISTWNHMLYYPYVMGNKQPMFEFLSKILWRSTKSDVIEQINIPAQTIQEHMFDLSAVEKFFYKREHETCANSFLAKLNTYETLDITLTAIDRHTLNAILTPLLSLRQVCTHPYAVRGRYLATKRQVNSMEDLLDVLIKKNVKECEECSRAVIAALNGTAGILLLQNRSLEAVAMYREALLFMDKYDNQKIIKVDKLQRIHTLFNLKEVLSDANYPTPPPTLRDDKLKDECEQVQSRYMEKYISQTNAALQDAKQASASVNKQTNKFIYKEGLWCAELIEWMIENSLDNEMLKRVHSLNTSSNNKYSGLSDAKSVLYLLTTWIDKIKQQLRKLRQSFKTFENAFYVDENKHINQDLVNSAMECHLRPANTEKYKKKPCLCCVLDTDLKKFECVLFQMNKRVTLNNKERSNKGNWHPCCEESILKVIYQFAKLRGCDSELLADGETHIVLCEKRRKEFKELRKLYTFYFQQVSAQDELNICKIRFRLRNTAEPVKVIPKKQTLLKSLDYEIENKYEFIHLMSEVELDYNFSLLKEEKIVNEAKLKNYLGTHSYLETLRKQQYAGQSPDPCPICQFQLVESWSILLCGHCYCLDCIHKLLDQFKGGKFVTCSVCRKRQSCDDISYIKLKGGTETSSDEFEIKGSHSTKIHAVIRKAVDLHKIDPSVKILIFSKWQPVLKVLSDALQLNNISHEYLSTYKIQDKLKKFKDPNNSVTALLLPVCLGAKGLNLIEATHVFLVEPLMNPSEELQALGRVHRIGQTRPTVVHRFLIKNTIEENIHNAITANAQQWNDKKLTLAQLKTLFTQNTE